MSFDLFLTEKDARQSRLLTQNLLALLDQSDTEQQLSIAGIDNLLKAYPLKPPAQDLAPLMIGVMLAKHSQNKQRLNLAIQTLRKSQSSTNPYNRLLANYLERHGSFEPPTTVFSAVTPFDAWKKSKLYSTYMKGVVDQTVEFAKRNPPPNTTPTIVDIGTGSGVLIASVVNQLSNETNLRSVRLILNDQSQAMLKSASDHCRQTISTPLDIMTHEDRIENTSIDDMRSLSNNQTPWFVLASASAHHMPEEEKIQILKTLSLWTPNVLIGEFEANNDLPEPDSPELFYSVASFYGYLFKDILEGPATEEEKKATIEQFLLAESINMLKSNKKSGSAEEGGRVDYHTTSKEWMVVAQKAGLRISAHKTLVSIPDGRPVTFFLHFRKEIQ